MQAFISGAENVAPMILVHKACKAEGGASETLAVNAA